MKHRCAASAVVNRCMHNMHNMHHMHHKLRTLTSTARRVMLPLLAWAVAGCSSLWPAPSPQPAFFTLQAPVATAAATSPKASSAAAVAGTGTGPVLVVQVPRASPGFDSARIIYTRQPQQLEYFARHEWVDAPARLLAPLMVAALERGSTFSAVVLAPSAATGSLQLDTQLLRLQQEFGSVPSRVRLSMRAQLIHTASRQVLATRDFEQVVDSATEDAPGGAAAAQSAAAAVLADMAAWCQAAVAAQPLRGAP